MNVAVVSEVPAPYRAPLFERLAARGDLDLKVFYCAAAAPWQPSEDEGAFPSRVLPGWTVGGRRGAVIWKLNPSVGRELKGFEPSVVIVGGYAHPTMLLSIAWCKRRRVPYVLHSESHGLAPRSRLRKMIKAPLIRWVIHGAAGFLAVSSPAREHLMRYGAEDRLIFILPNLPDVKRFQVEADAIRNLESAPPVKLAFIGRLVEAKGLPVLLAALEHLRRPDDFHLSVHGDGPLREKLENFCRQKGLKNVSFRGYLEAGEAPQAYAEADCLVLPSYEEPFGVVVMEALAAGIPVVVSDRVGSGPDFIQPGVNGYEFNAGDHLDLARVLDELAKPEKLSEMKSKARGSVMGWTYGRAEDVVVKALDTATRASAHKGDDP